MERTLCYNIIKETALANDFIVEGAESSFIINSDKVHTVSFKIVKKDVFYVYQWEYEIKKFSKISIYSLKDKTDVIKFCNILVNSYEIRARR